MHVTDLSKIDIFVRVFKEKMIDHQYREKGTGNIYSNYNQIRAIDETLKIPAGKVLAVSVSEFTRVLQFSSTSPGMQGSYHYCMCTNRQLFL